MADAEVTPARAEEFDAQGAVKAKILHALEIFPFVSASMIHMAIGTATMSALWKPVLDKLVDEGEVVLLAVAAAGLNRAQVYHIYHLPKAKYPAGDAVTAVTRIESTPSGD